MAEEKITENAVAKAMAPSLATLKNIEQGISKLGAQGNQGAEAATESKRAEKISVANEEKTNTLLGAMVKSLADLNKNILASMKGGIFKGLGILLAGITAPIIIMVGFFKQLALEFTFLKKLTGGGLKKLFTPLKNLLSGKGKIGTAIKNTLKFIDKAHFGVFTKIGNFFKSFSTSPGITKLSKTLTSVKTSVKTGITAIKNLIQPLGKFFASMLKLGRGFVSTSKTAAKIVGWAGGFGKLLGKIFLPITILMSAFDFITGFMDGFEEDGILGGLEEGLSKLFKGLIGMPLDLLKKVVGWALGLMGFDKAKESLADFSFSDLIGDVIGGFFDMVDGVVKWVKKTFSFGSIAEALTSMLKLIWMPAILFKEWLIDPVVGWLGKMFGFDTTKFKEFSVFDGIQTLLEDMGKFFTDIFNIDFKSVLKPMILAVPGGKALWAAAAGLGSLFGGDDKAAAAAEEKRSKKQETKQRASDARTGGGFFSDIKQSLGFGPKDKEVTREQMSRGSEGTSAQVEKTRKARKLIGKGALQQLKEDEGFESEVYEDTEGIKTIGYGFNLERAGTQDALAAAGIDKSVADLKSGKMNLSEEEAERLMMGEMPYFRQAAKRFLGKDKWTPFPSDKKDALTNMAYNLGESGLNKFVKLREALRNGDWQEASNQIMFDSKGNKSKYAGQVKGRAGRLASSFSAPVAPETKTASLNSLQTENAQGKMGSGQSAPTIVSAPQTTTNNSNSSTSLLLPPTAKDSFWDSAV